MMSEEIKDKESMTEAQDLTEQEVQTEQTEQPEWTEQEVQPEQLGLRLSDTDDYNVNDGVQDEAAESEGDADDAEKKKKRQARRGRFLAFIFGIAFCLCALLLCAKVFGVGRFILEDDYTYYKDLDDAYGKYYEIMLMIGEDPIAEKAPDEINDEELKKIVASIGDPYAEYYTAPEYEELEKRYMSDYVGVGIGVVQEDDKVVIKTIFTDSPAEEAGMQPEDVIVKVDGKEPADVDEAVDMISGEEGAEVTITVRRGEQIIDFTVKRSTIETDSVTYTVLDGYPEVGYIAMSMFRRSTDDEFKAAVRDLQASGCDKYILDLRDNGGGLTDPCIEIADYLLPSCKIMSQNTKRGEETVYNSNSSSADLDLVVLVNENTASASEILTAALQDNGAATVIGTNTYGKGVIQTVHQFDDGSAIKITTEEYFRPSGKPVHKIGITPDIEAEGDAAIDAALRELGQ